MNRSDVVAAIAKRNQIPRRAADAVVSGIFDTIADALKQGNRVEVRGLGSFTTRHYHAYTGRNPRTGEPVQVPPKRLPFFKVGKDLRERINR